MSHAKVATDFDQIIQQERQRKRNQELASQIFGRNKPKEQNKKDKNTPRSPSLASRIGGVQKQRSASASSNTTSRPQLSRPSSQNVLTARQARLATEINNAATTNIVPTTKPGTASLGLTIKGSAAPFVVEARNFASGTTDADIESAIQADCMDASGNNTLVSCKVIQTRPTVIAELVFNERTIADSIISKYHKQRADGHTLELKMVRSGPGSMSKQHQANKKNPAQQPAPHAQGTPEVEVTVDDNVSMEDIEMAQPQVQTQVPPQIQAQAQMDNAYEDTREDGHRARGDRGTGRDRDDYQSSGRRRDDGRRRGDREQDQDLVTEEGGGEDRDRDRGYDNRGREEPRSYTRRDEPRSGRPSHYGNGVGGPRPAAYGGGYAGGRGSYSSYGGGGYGSRGGYRASYRGYRSDR